MMKISNILKLCSVRSNSQREENSLHVPANVGVSPNGCQYSLKAYESRSFQMRHNWFPQQAAEYSANKLYVKAQDSHNLVSNLL